MRTITSRLPPGLNSPKSVSYNCSHCRLWLARGQASSPHSEVNHEGWSLKQKTQGKPNLPPCADPGPGIQSCHCPTTVGKAGELGSNPLCGAAGSCTSIPEGLSLPASRVKTLSANVTDSLLCTRKTIQFLPLRPLNSQWGARDDFRAGE